MEAMDIKKRSLSIEDNLIVHDKVEDSFGMEEQHNTAMSPQRKKVRKASRACDQCRKRKIKCDYDNVSTICNNCGKNNERCTFKRVQLKRGPSKGYTKHHLKDPLSGGAPPTAPPTAAANTAANAASAGATTGSATAAMPTATTQSTVLLPPISQYFPASNEAIKNEQQFWKVPYHEFNNSATTGNLFGSQNPESARSSVDLNFTANIPNVANDILSSDNESFTPNITTNRSRSSSIPPLVRYRSNTPTNNTALTNSPNFLHQPLYSTYSQFSQLQSTQNLNNQAQSGLPLLSQNILVSHNNNLPLIPSQYNANKTKSRSGSFSIVSDSMSNSFDPKIRKRSNSVKSTPSVSTAKYSINNIITVDNNIHSIDTITSTNALTNSNQEIGKNLIISSTNSLPKSNNKNKKGQSQSEDNQNSIHNTTISNDKNIHFAALDIFNPDQHSSDAELTINYGQILDMDLINTYYEFIHLNFPLIPVNKKTLTNDILLINTSHEMNSCIIKWFRNSLELLVRIAMKKSNKPYANSTSDKKGLNNETKKLENEKNPTVEEDSDEIYINSINRIFKNITMIYPKIQSQKITINSRILIVYLSTFMILNYILILIGKKNPFIFSNTVTIFNDCNISAKLFHQKLSNDIHDYQIMFIRLYILLIIFDSILSISYGSPTLITVPMNKHLFIKIFDMSSYLRMNNNQQFTQEYINKWCIEEDPIRLNYIMKGLELAEVLINLSHHRLYHVNHQGFEQYIKTIRSDESSDIMNQESNELIYIYEHFKKLLIIKKKFLNCLFSVIDLNENKIKYLNLEDCFNLTQTLCSLISSMLSILTLMMRLNPTNCIDYNFKPPSQMPTNDEKTTNFDENNVNCNININNDAINIRNGNNDNNDNNDNIKNDNNNNGNRNNDSNTNSDFYRKLLGLNNNNNADMLTDLKDLPRGCISPYFIIIKSEICNIHELIKQLPTSLIGILIEASIHSQIDTGNNRPHSSSPHIQPQSLVVKLSNSMNEIVQITSLLSLINPNNIVHDNSSHKKHNNSNDKHKKNREMGTSAFEKLYYDSINKPDLYTNLPKTEFTGNEFKIDNGINVGPGSLATLLSLDKIVKLAWQLLDDSELGWL